MTKDVIILATTQQLIDELISRLDAKESDAFKTNRQGFESLEFNIMKESVKADF